MRRQAVQDTVVLLVVLPISCLPTCTLLAILAAASAAVMSPASTATFGEPACLHLAAACSTAAASRSVSSSWAPSLENRSAAASPMPLAAPAVVHNGRMHRQVQRDSMRTVVA
jgi:hypothetical protein